MFAVPLAVIVRSALFDDERRELQATALQGAVRIDPDFGNPYNVIGVYLMQQDKLDEAIPWLERAKQAPRYEPRHFPYMNLGRVFVKQGKWWDALRELETAVRVAPRDAGARHALHELRGRMN